MARAATLVVTCSCTFHPGATSGGDALVDDALAGDASGSASAHIAFDAQSTASATGVAMLQWNHTVGAGLADSLLVVGVSIEKTNGETVASATYGGVALVRAGGAGQASGVKAELWFLTSPEAGTHEVAVTFTTTLASDGAVGGAISLSGVDQATPIPLTATNDAGSGKPETMITTAAPNAWVLDTITVDNGNAATPGAGQVERWSTPQSTRIRGGGSTLATAAPSATTMMWTSTSDGWAQIVAEIEP